MKLRDLAKDVEKRLKLQAMRVIGDPDVRVSRAALLQGTPPFHAATVLTKVDVVVAGEQREWEGVEYTADANTAGERKGMILIGHWVSEDQGMRVCADWLKTFISEVPIQWMPGTPSGDREEGSSDKNGHQSRTGLSSNVPLKLWLWGFLEAAALGLLVIFRRDLTFYASGVIA